MASPWILVSTSEAYTEAVTIRVDSIRHHENNSVSFWLGEVTTDKTQPHDARISVIQANCDNQRFQVVQINSFNEGVLVGKANAKTNVEISLPGSMMSEAIMMACLKNHGHFVSANFSNPKQMATEVKAFLHDMQKEHVRKK